MRFSEPVRMADDGDHSPVWARSKRRRNNPIIGNNVGDGNAGTGAAIGAVVGGAAGAIRGSQQDRANQQRYRDSQGRYYYCYDGRQTECYWEDGRRR